MKKIKKKIATKINVAKQELTKLFNLKYDEISISSSYEGYHTSCNYFNGIIYLFGNFKTVVLFLLAKFNIYKSDIFKI